MTGFRRGQPFNHHHYLKRKKEKSPWEIRFFKGWERLELRNTAFQQKQANRLRFGSKTRKGGQTDSHPRNFSSQSQETSVKSLWLCSSLFWPPSGKSYTIHSISHTTLYPHFVFSPVFSLRNALLSYLFLSVFYLPFLNLYVYSVQLNFLLWVIDSHPYSMFQGYRKSLWFSVVCVIKHSYSLQCNLPSCKWSKLISAAISINPPCLQTWALVMQKCK